MLTFASSVLELKGVGAESARKLQKLDIHSIQDLLFHVPFRYDDLSKQRTIASLLPDEEVTLRASVLRITQIQSRFGKSMIKGTLQDETGKVDVLWFHQPYILYSLKPGSLRAFSGAPKLYKGKLSFINPIVEEIKEGGGLHTGRLVPIYSETMKLSSRTLRGLIHSALQETEIPENYPPKFREQHHLLDLKTALQALHFPESLPITEDGRRRLAFDEVFSLLQQAQEKKRTRKQRKAIQTLQVDAEQQRAFVRLLPFTPSPSQTQAMFDIALDFVQSYPCDRLIQGEVGSGKTVLAAFAGFCAAKNKTNAVLLAPTQILAKQHFHSLETLLSPAGIPVRLLVAGSEAPKDAPGTIYVGTHAVFQHAKTLQPAVVIVDEEHRFGVKQREVFLRGRKHPHLLTMTATPIPRTAAQTVLADRDVTVLEEIPEKKKRIKTWVVAHEKREASYGWIAERMKAKEQVFVVCPFIGESTSETLQSVKAAETEYVVLQKKFPTFKLALLHGKTPKDHRERILDAFSAGTLDMLVSTPVVEVGIDIPKATVMVIESAERFGLAQLHQLRGRVGRRGQQAYCLLFSEHPEAMERLKPLETLESGNELAELDLHRRGAGDILGVRQSGWSGLQFASWFDTDLIAECKSALNNPTSLMAE